MTTQTRTWKPLFEGDTVNIAVTAVSQFLAIPKTPMGVRTLRLVNVGAAITFVELVENAATTTSPTIGIPLLPNSVTGLTMANDEVGLAVIGTAANTLYVTPGEGLVV